MSHTSVAATLDKDPPTQSPPATTPRANCNLESPRNEPGQEARLATDIQNDTVVQTPPKNLPMPPPPPPLPVAAKKKPRGRPRKNNAEQGGEGGGSEAGRAMRLKTKTARRRELLQKTHLMRVGMGGDDDYGGAMNFQSMQAQLQIGHQMLLRQQVQQQLQRMQLHQQLMQHHARAQQLQANPFLGQSSPLHDIREQPVILSPSQAQGANSNAPQPLWNTGLPNMVLRPEKISPRPPSFSGGSFSRSKAQNRRKNSLLANQPPPKNEPLTLARSSSESAMSLENQSDCPTMTHQQSCDQLDEALTRAMDGDGAERKPRSMAYQEKVAHQDTARNELMQKHFGQNSESWINAGQSKLAQGGKPDPEKPLPGLPLAVYQMGVGLDLAPQMHTIHQQLLAELTQHTQFRSIAKDPPTPTPTHNTNGAALALHQTSSGGSTVPMETSCDWASFGNVHTEGHKTNENGGIKSAPDDNLPWPDAATLVGAANTLSPMLRSTSAPVGLENLGDQSRPGQAGKVNGIPHAGVGERNSMQLIGGNSRADPLLGLGQSPRSPPKKSSKANNVPKEKKLKFRYHEYYPRGQQQSKPRTNGQAESRPQAPNQVLPNHTATPRGDFQGQSQPARSTTATQPMTNPFSLPQPMVQSRAPLNGQSLGSTDANPGHTIDLSSIGSRPIACASGTGKKRPDRPKDMGNRAGLVGRVESGAAGMGTGNQPMAKALNTVDYCDVLVEQQRYLNLQIQQLQRQQMQMANALELMRKSAEASKVGAGNAANGQDGQQDGIDLQQAMYDSIGFGLANDQGPVYDALLDDSALLSPLEGLEPMGSSVKSANAEAENGGWIVTDVTEGNDILLDMALDAGSLSLANGEGDVEMISSTLAPNQVTDIGMHAANSSQPLNMDHWSTKEAAYDRTGGQVKSENSQPMAEHSGLSPILGHDGFGNMWEDVSV